MAACWMATWSLEQGTRLGSRVGGTRSIRRERGWEWDRRERQYGSGATPAVVNIHLVAAAFAQPANTAAFAAADVAGTSLWHGLLPGRSVGSGGCLADSLCGGDCVRPH